MRSMGSSVRTGQLFPEMGKNQSKSPTAANVPPGGVGEGNDPTPRT